MSAPESAVAIVGIGCLFPKSPDLGTYWRNLLAATDCLSDVPADHSWSPADYYDADPTAPDKTWATRGGFLDKLPFDPMQFGIPPAMLESIDTTQLLSLVVAREALRDAGIDPDGGGWNRDRVGVIVGITGTQEMAITAGARLQGPIWRRSLLRCGVDPRLADVIVKDIANHFPTWTEQTFPGLLGNVVSGRIANRLDLGGTNAVVDAACASSLAALQYAIGDLMAGRSDLVLTGGADTLNDIFMFECFTRTPAFTKKGDARPFDAGADGILIGEGIAMLALKRRADAERDGDRVYAVIKAVGSSSDGRFKSIYAPNPTGQAKALRRSYAAAGVDPSTVELVEAHGTGTKAGDAAEIEALKTVYREARPEGRWVALGSVKAQIGHTKSTAGAAGLVKAALALHQRVLPPAAKIDQPNPKMAFDQSPFYLSPRARPWIRAGDHPRRAAVSAFGFGGSNFHAVLEEFGDDTVAAASAADQDLFLLGGDTVEALSAAIAGVAGPTVTHASRAALAAWTPGKAHVAGFLAGSLPELEERKATALRRLKGEPARPKDHVWVGSGQAAGTVAFLFPGQGSQYVEMGRTLAIRHPALRKALDAADESFRRAGLPALSSRTFPPPAWTPGDAAAQQEALRATEWAQPALGALSTGMAAVLAGFGVAPDALAGHSYGELVALHLGGVFDAETLLSLSRERGRLMRSGGRDRGTMAAVDGPLDEVEALLRDVPDVVLANRNHPTQGVLSGSREGVAKAVALLGSKRLRAKELAVSAAFHSPLVADARDPFRAALGGADVVAATTPVYGCATAAPYPTDADAIRDALAVQLVSPVDFVGVVDRLWADGVRTFVEVGPKGVLAALVEACLTRTGRRATVVALDRSAGKEDGDTELKRALCELAAAGVPVDPSPLLRERAPATPLVATSRTVPIGGANHRNPETLEPPMPKDLPKPAPVAPDVSGWGAVPSSGQPMQKPVHLESDRSPAPPATLPRPAAPVNGDVLALLDATRQTLAAFQDAQARTAEVHGRFLDAFARANDNFARLFEAQARLVERFGGAEGAPIAARAAAGPHPALAPLPAPPPLPPAHFPGLVVPPPSDPVVAPGSVEPGRVAIPSSDRPAVASDLPPLFDALAAVNMKSAPKAAASVPVTRVGRGAVTEAMLDAVAAKTGYPRDALDLGMDLESDLGIDSIKRVEILSAVRERVPGLPEVDNEKLGSMRTLQEVVSYLAAQSSEPTEVAPFLVPHHPPKRDALVGALLEAVSSKTGYPRDALELTMDLESDLGIDSIKRVEILSAVRERIPELPELDNEALAALRTLQDVADHLGGVAAGLGFASIGSGVPNAGSPALLVPPAADPVPARPDPGLPPVQTAMELHTEASRDPRDRRSLRRRSVTVVAAPPARPYRAEGAWWVVGDPSLAEAFRAAGHRVVDEAVPGLAGVVWADADVRAAFRCARAVGAVPRFVTVSRRGGRFGRAAWGHPPEVLGAGRGEGLSGLAKTLAHEWPGTSPLHVDAADGVPVARIVREVHADRGVREVGLTDDGAWTLVDAVEPAEAVPAPLVPGDLVVVTGGARGVTAACALALAKAVRPTLLLLGRSDPEREPAWAGGVADEALLAQRLSVARASGERIRPRDAEAQVTSVRAMREARDTLAALRATGATVSYRAVDGRDPAAVARAVAEAQAEHGPVRGLVHGMGVLADKKLADKTDAMFDLVWGTKLDGLAALFEAVDRAELRWVCAFTSVAGRYGNAGQVDYSMANEALVQRLLDQAARHPGCRVKAIDWGPWDGGMVDATLRERFAERGHRLIPLADGATVFVDELSRPEPEVVVEAPLPARGSQRRTVHADAPWARDHRIGGKAVLPVAMALEWFLALARDVRPEAAALRVLELRVLKGVVFDADALDLTLTWAPIDDRRIAVRLERGSLLHYKAVVEAIDAAPTEPFAGSNGLAGTPWTATLEETYAGSLFHGPTLRAIERIEGRSDQGAVAHLQGSTPTAFGEAGTAWVTDPLLVDGALQLLLVWVRDRFGTAALPTAVGRFEATPAFRPGASATVHLRVKGDAVHGSFGATWVDGAGRVVLRLEGGEYATTPGLVLAFQNA